MILFVVISLQLVESNEAIWDDGVAPEYTIDFDAQHVDSAEGLGEWKK